jgi:predicted alpha/beta superfamily hydrolase
VRRFREAPAAGAWQGRLLRSTPVAGGGLAPRELLVYLPADYGDGRKRPVAMLLDGQNLFDDAASFAGSWRAAEAVDRIAADALAPIVVGIPNSGARRLVEYTPFRDPRHGGGGARRTLALLAETVRPLIERSFSVDRANGSWALGGASLGGHFALWSFFAAPALAGAAIAMSPTTLWGGQSLLAFVERARERGGRIHLDCGTEEGRRRGRRASARSSPTAYVRRVRRLRRALGRKGFAAGESLAYVEQDGATHDERAWGSRLEGALRFVLAPDGPPARVLEPGRADGARLRSRGIGGLAGPAAERRRECWGAVPPAPRPSRGEQPARGGFP